MWGFCEGSDYATVSTEAICYGVLDFFAKVVFGWIVILNLGLLANGSKGGRWANLVKEFLYLHSVALIVLLFMCLTIVSSS